METKSFDKEINEEINKEMGKEKNYTVSKEEFLDLKDTVKELKIALIGIDGKNGFRGTLRSLDNRMSKMEDSVSKISASMDMFKSRDLLVHETFATKMEVVTLKQEIINEINMLSKERDEMKRAERKRDEDVRIESDKLNIKRKDLVYVKLAIRLSMVGIFISSVFTMLNFFLGSGGCP